MASFGLPQDRRHGDDREIDAKGLGALLTRAWDVLRGVFRRGDEVRADVIAELEASEAVNAAAVEAVEVVTRNQAARPRKIWKVDGGPCETCIGNRDAGPIPLGQAFPSGASWPPQHANCMCAVAIIDVRVGPRRIRKR